MAALFHPSSIQDFSCLKAFIVTKQISQRLMCVSSYVLNQIKGFINNIFFTVPILFPLKIIGLRGYNDTLFFFMPNVYKLTKSLVV